MQRTKRTFMAWAAGITLCLLLLVIGAAYAQAGGFNLPWWTADGGGGDSSAAGYSLRGTIGQPDAGVLSGPGYQLSGGFWAGGAPPTPPGNAVYLPVVTR